MNAPCSGPALTAPHVTTGGLCRWKAINKKGRHVGLDVYALLIKDHYTFGPSRPKISLSCQNQEASKAELWLRLLPQPTQRRSKKCANVNQGRT